MKALLIAFLISSILNFNIMLPKTQSVQKDDGMIFEDLRILADSVSQGEWMTAIPQGLSLLSKVSKIARASTSPLRPTFNFDVQGKTDPYTKCVMERLHLAKKPAKMFMSALYKGYQKKAQEALKDLTKCLYEATLCKKD